MSNGAAVTSASLWDAAAETIERDEDGAFATVARHRGSLPMASDAKMLVGPNGRRMGTVGGGCVEADVIRQAMESMSSGHPAFVRHTLNAELAGDLGLSCGGTVELFLEPLPGGSEAVALFRGVADGIRSRSTVTVLTAVNWGDGVAKTAIIGSRVYGVGETLSADWLEQSHPQWSNTFVDQTRSVFVERIPRRPRVIIFGAGHVGVEIARLAAGAGFHVVITDDRADFANAERVPEAHEVIASDFNTFLDEISIDEDDFVLATTRGHEFDATIVQRTAASRARYVGMLGSKRKRSVVLKALSTAGVSKDALDRVRSPIGLEIGADSPTEIAVSVVAELIRIRRTTQD